MVFQITNTDFQALRQHQPQKKAKESTEARVYAHCVQPLITIEKDKSAPALKPLSPQRYREMADTFNIDGTLLRDRIASDLKISAEDLTDEHYTSEIPKTLASFGLSERLCYILFQHIRQVDNEKHETQEATAQLAYRFASTSQVWPFKTVLTGKTTINILAANQNQLCVTLTAAPKLIIPRKDPIEVQQETRIDIHERNDSIQCQAQVMCNGLSDEDLTTLLEQGQFNLMPVLDKVQSGIPLFEHEQAWLQQLTTIFIEKITEGKLSKSLAAQICEYVTSLTQRLNSVTAPLLDTEYAFAKTLLSLENTKKIVLPKHFKQLQRAISLPAVIKQHKPRWYRSATNNTARLLEMLGIKSSYSTLTSDVFEMKRVEKQKPLLHQATLFYLDVMLQQRPSTLAKGLRTAQLQQLVSLLSAESGDSDKTKQEKTELREKLISALLRYNPYLLNESSYKDRLLNPENLPTALLSQQLDCRKILFTKDVRRNKVIQLMTTLAGKQGDDTTAKRLLGLPAPTRWWHRFIKPEAVKLAAQMPAAACVSLLEAKPSLVFDYLNSLLSSSRDIAKFNEAQLTQLCGLLSGEQLNTLENNAVLSESTPILGIFQLRKQRHEKVSSLTLKKRMKNQAPTEVFGAPTSAFMRAGGSSSSVDESSIRVKRPMIEVKNK
ncbi:MAG: hypothetical protein DHS20C10_12010 [marine bacterium B5-7]|nr:MAG: hypothetical protein DHS20C10_12010 [marine bacterium B5-7]